MTWPAVPELDDVTLAFPAHALDWMPAWEEIPEEYKVGTTEAERIARQWFYRGLGDQVEFYARDGIDAEQAFRAIQATLRSFQPKHEHKMAAVAFMIDTWFSEVRRWEKS